MAKATGEGKGAAKTVVTSEVARDQLGELLNRARFGRERIIITRHGERCAAIIGMEDLKRLEVAAV